jgi:hypothetical protein
MSKLPTLIDQSDPIPLKLRANDVVRHVVNVDSCFRERSTGSTSSDFMYPLLNPVRNVLRVRILSVEYPVDVPLFTAARRRTTLRILFRDLSGVLLGIPLVVPDGNYTVAEMVTVLNAEIAEAVAAGELPFPIVVSYVESTRRFVFTAAAPSGIRFGIDTIWGGWDREYDYGLGYYMGFVRGLHAARSDSSGNWTVTGGHCADFTGDKYVFLRINDYRGIRHYVNTTATDPGVNRWDYNEVVATTKICLGNVINGPDVIDNEVVFPTPINIGRINVQVVDRYGELVDLCGLPLSLSLEVLEVRNSSMYNMVRDGLAVAYR